MLRRVLLALMLSSVVAACSGDKEPAAAPAPAEPAAAPAAPVDVPPATPATGAPAEAATGAPAVTEPAPAPTPTPAPKPAPPAPTGEAPRLGIDYEILGAPQPTWGRGKIEVAEVFGYTCVHCFHFQPEVDAWHARLPADVRFEYVPAVFGGPWDTFARAYFAAEALGVREKTHDAVFKAVHVDRVLKSGSDEEVADLYAGLGVDRAKFIEAMTGFGTTAKLNKARQFATRTEVSGTPTMIVNGKYRVMSTRDRGFSGMLATVDYLVAMERAGTAPGAP